MHLPDARIFWDTEWRLTPTHVSIDAQPGELERKREQLAHVFSRCATLGASKNRHAHLNHVTNTAVDAGPRRPRKPNMDFFKKRKKHRENAYC